MHWPKSWRDVGAVADAFIPKRRVKHSQRRGRRPKIKKAKKGAKKKEKKAPKPKKIKAYAQTVYTGKEWQFRDCLPFVRFRILREDLAQPHPGQTSSPGRVDRGDSAASVRPKSELHVDPGSPPPGKPLPNRRRSHVKAATWSTLSSAGNSLSSAASKIKDALLRRRHTDLAPPTGPKPITRRGKDVSMPVTCPGVTEGEKPAPTPPRETTSMTAPTESEAPEIRTGISKSASNLEILRERLRKRAATSKAFNEIWESEGLPHLRKILNDNYDGSYSITIQFNYTSSTRLVEVMTSRILSNHVHREVERNVLPCFENEPQLMVEVRFLVGTVSHTADITRSSQEGPEDQWATARNRSRHSVQVCGDSVGVEGMDGAATLGPAVKLGDNRGWLVNWHLFEDIPNWETLDGDFGVPDHHLVHPAPMDCRENESPERIAKLRAFSGRMFETHRPSQSLRRFATSNPHDGKTVMNVVTDWAFCTAIGDELMHNRLRFAPPGVEAEEFSGPMRGQFTESPQLQIIMTTGRSSGLRYAVVCETPAEVRQLPTEPTREWYLEQTDVPPAFNWVCEGPGMPGDSGAAVVHAETDCVLGQIWGRNRYGGSRNDLRVTYFTHIMDIFDDITDRYPSEGPLALILGEDDRTSDNTNLHNGLSTVNVPRPPSTPDTLVRSTIADADDEHGADRQMAEGPACGMAHLNTFRRSAARTSIGDGGIMMRRNSMMIAT
ncbi:hypothetical protein LY76DRAFT_580996 [Colletotrichum caudatum]|nr:hypothetical protein LY76DRAFT_580996 [Colletotrichum caudatum]